MAKSYFACSFFTVRMIAYGMSDRRLAAILAGVALLARLLVYSGVAIFGTDAANMLRQVDAFVAGRFSDAMGPYHPGYPFLASLVQPLVGSERAGFWVSMILGSAAAAPLYLVARDAVGRGAAFLGGIFYAFHPHLVLLQADVMTEGTFLFFLFGAIWLGWETVKEPRWSTAALAGLASAAAFLTRAEGLIVVIGVPCWIAVSALRDRRRMRLATLAIVPVLSLIALYPWFLYVRAVTGKWGLTVKQSVIVVVDPPPPPPAPSLQSREPEVETKRGVTRRRQPYLELGKHALKVSYFVFAPLLLLGFAALRRQWGTFYYVSFPVLYWIAIAVATSRNPYTSYRYLLPGMALFLPICALGLKWRPSWRPWIAIVVVAVCFARLAAPTRTDERPFREAAAWIRTQNAAPIVLSSTDKISYLTGSPFCAPPPTWDAFEATVPNVDYIVFLEKDFQDGQPAYVARLRERLGEPVRVFDTVLVWQGRK